MCTCPSERGGSAAACWLLGPSHSSGRMSVCGKAGRGADGGSICCHKKTWLSAAPWGGTLIFAGELQALFHDMKKSLNHCAPGNSEDQDTGPSRILICVHYICIRAEGTSEDELVETPPSYPHFSKGQRFLTSLFVPSLRNCILKWLWPFQFPGRFGNFNEILKQKKKKKRVKALAKVEFGDSYGFFFFFCVDKPPLTS